MFIEMPPSDHLFNENYNMLYCQLKVIKCKLVQMGVDAVVLVTQN